MNQKSKLKVSTVLGTRPEIIRLSKTIHLLEQTVDHKLIHTGQNYDYELNEIFFKDLNIRKPDYFLEVNTSSLGNAIGDIIQKSEQVFLKDKPDCLLILGDTNSSLAGIIAKRMKIKIYHMEAGNRCFDEDTPEEVNRKIIDHISDYNLVYTEHARRNLLKEGIHPATIYLTGSPMKEVLTSYSYNIESSEILKELDIEKDNYFLVSVHREENVDKPDILRNIIEILNEMVSRFNKTVIVSTHPRTRNRLNNIKDVQINNKIKFLKPFGFFDYIKLQTEAACVISDSGTISEESSILNFPAITLRKSMERPEAIDTGTIILTGFDKQTVIDSINFTMNEFTIHDYQNIPFEYSVENTSWRTVKLILGTAISNRHLT